MSRTKMSRNCHCSSSSTRSSSVKRLAGKPVAIFLHSCSACNGIHFCTFPAALFLLTRFSSSPLLSSQLLSFRGLFRPHSTLARLEMKTSLKRALYALPSRSIFVRSFIPRHVFPARISRFQRKKHRRGEREGLVPLTPRHRPSDVCRLNSFFFHFLLLSSIFPLHSFFSLFFLSFFPFYFPFFPSVGSLFAIVRCTTRVCFRFSFVFFCFLPLFVVAALFATIIETSPRVKS